MSFGDERDTEPAAPPRPRHAAYVIEPSDQGVELRYVSEGTVRCRVWFSPVVAHGVLEGWTKVVTSGLWQDADPVAASVYERLLEVFRGVVNGAQGSTVSVPDGYEDWLFKSQN
jgi:hypothetical protein